MVGYYRQFIEESFERAKENDSLIPLHSEILQWEPRSKWDMNSLNARHLLNNLNRHGNSYLETGIHKRYGTSGTVAGLNSLFVESLLLGHESDPSIDTIGGPGVCIDDGLVRQRDRVDER